MPQLDPAAPRRSPALWARAAWTIGVGVYLVSLVYAMLVLPERVVAHTGMEGVDRWGSRGEHLTMSLIVLVVLLVGIPMLVRQVARPPGTMLNLPHKDYWLSDPDRAATFRQEVTEDALVLGGGLGIFLAAVLQIGTVRSTENPALATDGWMWLAFAAFAVGMAAWVWWVAASSRHRPPRD